VSAEACVLIAGGGPVGLACALVLGEAGVPVRLFEAGPDVVEELSTRAPRACTRG